MFKNTIDLKYQTNIALNVFDKPSHKLK